MAHDGTAIKKAAFLDALSKGLTVADAAQLGGYGRRHFYKLREADAEFAEDWEDAEAAGTDYLVREIRRRAFEGCRKPVIHQGAIVLHRVYDPNTGVDTLEELWLHEYSDTLAMFLLKSRDPEKFDDGIRRAKFERKWAKEDGKPDSAVSPGELIVAALDVLAAKLAAKPANAA